MVTKFENNFWGEGNHGFDMLMLNMRAGLLASKELGDFLKERLSVEDSYVKGLSKLHKTVAHVSGNTLGGFAPLWEMMTEMCSQLADVHSQFVKMLVEVSKEVNDYNVSQKDKIKTNIKGEIEIAQEALLSFNGTDSALQRTKKQYQQSVEHLAKAVAKQEKVSSDPSSHQKGKSQIESRVHQAKAWMETMRSDHQASTKNQCEHLMDFQGKMKEACQKFESIEEEHLAQMVTFMIKIAKTQDTQHLRTERVFAKVNEQLDIMSVEYLLGEVVRSKGTGKEKPVPYKFKSLEAPRVSLRVSSEEVRSTSPTAPSTRTQSKGEKGFKSFLKKKTKRSAGAASDGGPQVQVPEPDHAIDEDGYSIRPDDASSIGLFPGEIRPAKDDFDSDSDFDDEPESRIKKITIRESSEKPQASVDDIKASVMGLRIGSGSPGMKKATSSQSLNFFATPPPNHRDISANNSRITQDKSQEASAASLLDIDLILSGSSSNQLRGMPEPLLPQSSLPAPLTAASDQGTTDPTETLSPWNLPPPSTESKMSLSNSSSDVLTSEVPVLIPKPTPRLRTDPKSTTTKQQPLSAGNRNASEPAVPLLPSLLIPTKKPRTLSEPNEEYAASELSVETDNLKSDSISKTPTDTIEPPSKLVVGANKDKSLVSSPSSIPSLPPPRRSATTPKRNSSGQLASDVRVVSPLATSTHSASVSPTSVVQSVGNAKPVIPLAIALRETCNAIFQGTDVSKCVSKVTGEVVMSFPSNFLTELASSEPLVFRLTNSESVERVLHNQQLLKRNADDHVQFVFDMTALLSQLKVMQEKHTSPFYNVQLLKYEVKVADGDHLPMKLVCYWKCESTVTNFRLDYSYQSSLLETALGEKKPLTNVVISVPVNGEVQNALSKPSGCWNQEQGKMAWTIKDIQPQNEPSVTSLHAKFDVAGGPSVPSPAVVQFDFDGATLSHLQMELCSDSYNLSLVKCKCSSGKYMAEVKR